MIRLVRLVREFRLIPVVLFATFALLALKTFGLLFEGGYILADLGANDGAAMVTAPIVATEDSPAKPPAKTAAPVEAPPVERSWAQQMFNFPSVASSADTAKEARAPTAVAVEKAAPAPVVRVEQASAGDLPDSADVTGSVGNTKKTTAPAKAEDPRKGIRVKADDGKSGIPLATLTPDMPVVSAGERAVLERLQQRRETLDARSRDLDTRESLLKAAEKRLEVRVKELKDIEDRINAEMNKKTAAEEARFKSLITMYESMKAKDAAKIFDRLDMKVLLAVASKINPRRMADILAQMAPESAERLTLAFASRAGTTPKPPAPNELPKIEGHPTGG